jgi:hypothetical protein
VLQRRVDEGEDGIRGRHLDVELRHAGRGRIALARLGHVRRPLRLHRVDRDVGPELRHGFATGAARGPVL